MERFFSQKNIERYRRLIASPRDQRRLILKLLAEEAAQLKNYPHRRVNRLKRPTKRPQSAGRPPPPQRPSG